MENLGALKLQKFLQPLRKISIQARGTLESQVSTFPHRFSAHTGSIAQYEDHMEGYSASADLTRVSRYRVEQNSATIAHTDPCRFPNQQNQKYGSNLTKSALDTNFS